MTFFADIPPSSFDVVVVGGVAVGIAATAKCCNEIADFMARFKPEKPVDQQVQGVRDWVEQKFATKVELNHAKELFATTLVNQDTRITQMRTEVSNLTTLVRENEDRHEERAIQLHNRINPLLEAIGALREKAMRHSQVLFRPGDGK